MLEITGIGSGDAPQLAELDKKCFSVPWSERAFENEINNENAVYKIARTEGSKTAGYCAFWKVLDEGQITNIAVAPEYRRRHIAYELLGELIKEAAAQGLAVMTLEVRESNRAAIALYERFGFKTVGKRQNYYTNPREAALLMSLRLKNNFDGKEEKT